MKSLEELRLTSREIGAQVERALTGSEGLLASKQNELATRRREYSAARKALGPLSAGSPAMQRIGRTIGEELAKHEPELDELADEVRAIQAERKRLTRLLQLSKEEASASAATAAVVRPIVERLMRDNGSLTYDELYDLTREKLEASEISPVGLGLRVREAIVALRMESDSTGAYRFASVAPMNRTA